MIYLTGDTHGVFDRIADFCEKFHTTKDDVMIILGDAGINYYEGKRAELLKKMLDRMPITFFCIHGNHEQRPYVISSYEEQEWNGGSIYIERTHPSILFAKDGEVYDLDGKKAIVIGGAYSVDKFYRLSRHYAWFENEQPSDEIKQRVENTLEKMDWNVDIVLSHTTPLKYEPVEVFLSMIDQSTVDKNTEDWLDKIEDKLTYNKWYCGHYHTMKKIDKLQIMFEDYEMLNENID